MAHLTAGGALTLGIVGSKGIPWITWKFTQIPEAPKMAHLVHLTAGGAPPLGIVDSKSLPEFLWNSIGIPETPKWPT